jgi:hypothetical protein
MIAPETLADLARRVARLSINRRDPEQFFIERSELAAELRRLASQSVDVRKYSRPFTVMPRHDAE